MIIANPKVGRFERTTFGGAMLAACWQPSLAKGYAYVLFARPDDASHASSRANGSDLGNFDESLADIGRQAQSPF